MHCLLSSTLQRLGFRFVQAFASSDRYWRDGVVRQVGVGVLQRRVPGSKGGAENVAPGHKHEASKLWLGAAAPISSNGGPKRVPSARNS